MKIISKLQQEQVRTRENRISARGDKDKGPRGHTRTLADLAIRRQANKVLVHIRVVAVAVAGQGPLALRVEGGEWGLERRALDHGGISS